MHIQSEKNLFILQTMLTLQNGGSSSPKIILNMLGQTGKTGNTVPREFQPQKLSFFIIIGSFILENKNKMVFLSSYPPVLHWP